MKTDRQLKRDVEEELDWMPDVDATDIGVEVRDGVVMLSGHPASYAGKLAAEKAVQRLSGVKAIVVEMEVRLPHADVCTDVDIANAADSILRWTVGLHEGAVNVQVEKGWVTLRGDVDGAYQSQVAARRIAHMRGVTGVSNLIRVRATLVASDVGEKIGRALRRHAEREMKNIEIEVQNGTVTLTGKVSTYAERVAVRGAAWSAPGVHAVVDHLEVK